MREFSSCRSVWQPCKRFLKYRTADTLHESAFVMVRSKRKDMSLYPLFQASPLHILTPCNLQNAEIHHRLRSCSPMMQKFCCFAYKRSFVRLNWTSTILPYTATPWTWPSLLKSCRTSPALTTREVLNLCSVRLANMKGGWRGNADYAGMARLTLGMGTYHYNMAIRFPWRNTAAGRISQSIFEMCVISICIKLRLNVKASAVTPAAPPPPLIFENAKSQHMNIDRMM